MKYNDFFKIVILARNLISAIDHIHWEDRLDRMNHYPHFPYDMTVIWDTTCFKKSREYHFATCHHFCTPEQKVGGRLPL